MRIHPKARLWLLASASVLLIVGLGVAGLRLDWWVPQPARLESPFTFSDGFEDASSTDDLFPRDGRRWSQIQCESGDRPARNRVELTSEQVRSGARALKLVAAPYDGRTASKADIVRKGLHFVKGDDVWFTGWFYLVGADDVANVFLWDLEADRKRNAPGRRLFLQSGGLIASDLGKWHSGEKFRQPRGRGTPFPTDKWVRLKVRLHLSDGSDGQLQVWQDDKEVLNARGQTLPTAKAIYNRLQVGITANGNTTHARTLYLDDVVLSNRPLE